MLSILAAQYGTVSDIEIIWTVTALIGVIFSIHNFRQARADLKALRLAQIANGRKTLAKFNLKAEAARFVIQIIFFLIGVSAMTLADPPDQLLQPLKIVIVSALIRWGLVIAAALVTLKSYWAWEVRKSLIKDRTIVAATTEAVASARIQAQDVHVSGENVEVNGG